MPTNGLLPPDVGEIYGEANDGEEEVQVAAPRLPLSVFCTGGYKEMSSIFADQ
jgi:hypothetical protein